MGFSIGKGLGQAPKAQCAGGSGTVGRRGLRVRLGWGVIILVLAAFPTGFHITRKELIQSSKPIATYLKAANLTACLKDDIERSHNGALVIIRVYLPQDICNHALSFLYGLLCLKR